MNIDRDVLVRLVQAHDRISSMQGDIASQCAEWDTAIADIRKALDTPDQEKIMAKAHELFGFASNLGGFEDAVRELVTYITQATPADGQVARELLDKVNELIAEHYANTLPDARF